jgi:hypothetical protein
MGRAEESTGPQPGTEQELAELRAAHGGRWAIGREDGRWLGARRDGAGPVLSRASAPGLDIALRISREAGR